jgi:Zn-dependent peptidase ImmA (M78 family)
MNDLVLKASRKASEIRRANNYTKYQPLNIFDLCIKLDLTVRFVDVNMEGMYFSQQDGTSPQILISTLRPLPRRVFTCAHELGHHLFGHGDKVDAIADEKVAMYDKDEYLVDTFAGNLLMPIAAVLAELAKRNWDINRATPEQVYTISSIFGTGYNTLITHCYKNNVLNEAMALSLGKSKPATILKNLVGTDIPNSHFKIFDEQNPSKAVDLEQNNILIIPAKDVPQGNHLIKLKTLSNRVVYRAEKAGIIRISNAENESGYFVRIQSAGYQGFAEYRHLEKEKEI